MLRRRRIVRHSPRYGQHTSPEVARQFASVLATNDKDWETYYRYLPLYRFDKPEQLDPVARRTMSSLRRFRRF